MLFSKIRYHLGLLSHACGAQRWARIAAVRLTSIVINCVKKPSQIVGVYGRRSLLDADFHPFWSDVDITLIVSIKGLEDYQAVQKFYDQLKMFAPWVKDIEVIDVAFLSHWSRGGGFRKWSAASWIAFYGPPLNSEFYPSSLKQRAFDLAWELRFVFEQFLRLHREPRLQDNPYRLVELRKITGEFLRLSKIDLTKENWHGMTERSKLMAEHFGEGFFAFKSQLTPHLSDLDQIIAINLDYQSELMESLKRILESFYADYDHPKIHPLSEKSLATFEIFGRKFFILEQANLELIHESHREGAYWIRADMLKLFKAIGFQEQDHLLKMMKHHEFEFLDEYLRTRLMQDYYQALLERESESVIYFCEFAIKNYLNVRKNLGILIPSPNAQVDGLSAGLRLVRQLLDS